MIPFPHASLLHGEEVPRPISPYIPNTRVPSCHIPSIYPLNHRYLFHELISVTHERASGGPHEANVASLIVYCYKTIISNLQRRDTERLRNALQLRHFDVNDFRKHRLWLKQEKPCKLDGNLPEEPVATFFTM